MAITMEQREQRRAGLIEPVPQVSASEASMGSDRTRVVIAQIAPRLGDLGTNLKTHLELISEARSGGAGVVVFPELSLTGYFLKDLVTDVAIRLDSPIVKELAEAANGIDVLVGAVVESGDNRFYNAALYFSNQRLHFVHRKIYLPTYGLFDEGRYLAPGEQIRTFVIPGRTGRELRAGIMICEDMWHPSVAGLLARQGVDVYFCLSASPGRGVKETPELGTAKSYDAMTRTYAQLFTAYVVYCNRVGYEDGIAFWGGSRLVGPDGSVVSGPAGRDTELLITELDPGALRRARIANPLVRDERHDLNDAEAKRIRRRIPSD